MSAEIAVSYRSGADLRVIVFSANSGSLAWAGLFFTNYAAGSLASFAIPPIASGGMASHGGTFYYTDFPQGIPAGLYNVVLIDTGLGSGKNNPGQGTGQIQWAGDASGSRFVMPLSQVATSGLFANAFPTQLSRSFAVRNFPVYLKSSEDHFTPFTSGIVSGQIARDSGLFTALQSGQIVEVGHGFYNVMGLTSGDLDAGTAKMLFVARGVSGGWSDPLAYSLVLQRNANSGS
jgi:hypothetical protein